MAVVAKQKKPLLTKRSREQDCVIPKEGLKRAKKDETSEVEQRIEGEATSAAEEAETDAPESDGGAELDAAVAEPGADAGSDDDGAALAAEVLAEDPYLFDERHCGTNTSTRWTNKQRTMLLGCRGMPPVHRYLMTDFRDIMPHHKHENKWPKTEPFERIPEVAELSNCNNFMFFESRKDRLFLWIGRNPNGPTMKFQIHNISTKEGVFFIGNCLKHSRPLMVFDKHFSGESDAAESVPLRIARELIVQAVGTPRHHPKAKPFHDHVLSFVWNDGHIWARHYQIYTEGHRPRDAHRIESQHLREIGPRLSLEPIRVFDGAMRGATLWKNPKYKTPTQRRVSAKRLLIDQMKAHPLNQEIEPSSEEESVAAED